MLAIVFPYGLRTECISLASLTIVRHSLHHLTTQSSVIGQSGIKIHCTLHRWLMVELLGRNSNNYANLLAKTTYLLGDSGNLDF